jgi:hypothetical protein
MKDNIFEQIAAITKPTMSNKKHTPGTLSIGLTKREIDSRLFVTKVFHEIAVKDIYCRVWGTTEQEAKNRAKLIAAGPELLEALTIIYKQADKQSLCLTVSEWDKIEAAINKATQ